MDKKCYNKIFKLIVGIVVISTLAKMYYETKLLDLTIGILNLEFGNKKIFRVSCKSLMYIVRSEDPDELFEKEMLINGWKLDSVYGRGNLYVRNGIEILVIAKELFSRYTVYEVQNKHYFLSIEESA